MLGISPSTDVALCMDAELQPTFDTTRPATWLQKPQADLNTNTSTVLVMNDNYGAISLTNLPRRTKFNFGLRFVEPTIRECTLSILSYGGFSRPVVSGGNKISPSRTKSILLRFFYRKSALCELRHERNVPLHIIHWIWFYSGTYAAGSR